MVESDRWGKLRERKEKIKWEIVGRDNYLVDIYGRYNMLSTRLIYLSAIERTTLSRTVERINYRLSPILSLVFFVPDNFSRAIIVLLCINNPSPLCEL